MEMKIGHKYSLYPELPVNHPNRKTIHIRSIVDEVVIVYCCWSKGKQYWWYDTNTQFYFDLLEETNNIKHLGKSTHDWMLEGEK